MSDTREFPAVESMLRASAIVRALDTVARWWTAAGANSAVASRALMAAAQIRRAAPADRVRAFALAIGIASAGHLILLQVVPAQVAPTIPRALWLSVAAAALLAAQCAAAVAGSWNSSVVRRLLRRTRRFDA
jgi:hypothetical protein